MKTFLLFIFTVVTFIGFSQFTQSNEPQIGESSILYVCDSSFSSDDSNKGDGVTWDFSLVTADAGETNKALSVQASSNSNFSTATKITSIPSFLETYWASSSNSKSSKGFIYYTNDNSVGNFEVRFNTDDEKILDYPSAFGSTQTDTYSGTFINSMYAASGSPCTGTISSNIDGRGTLILPGNNTYTNVLRHKVTETTNSTINLAPFGPVNVVVTRVQYDYYDLASSTLPLFSYIDIAYDAGGFIKDRITLVLTSIAPGTAVSTASLQDDLRASKIKVYPNPVTGGVFYFDGDVSNDSEVSIIDPNGREILKYSNRVNGSVDVSALDSGVYFIRITSGTVVSVIKIIIE